MKSRREDHTKGFQRFDVVITIESEAEARGLYAVFNYSPNLDVLPGGANDLRYLFDEYDIKGKEDEIANGITYREFYCSKEPVK